MKQGKQPVTKLWLQTHFLSPQKFQASFMTFCPLIHLFFLSSLLTHSIHNYYKCYHFCYFSYLTLFLACSTPVIEINDRITRFSFNQNLIFFIYIIKHDIQMHVFEKESLMKWIHLFSKITNLTFHFQQQLPFTEQNQFWKINIFTSNFYFCVQNSTYNNQIVDSLNTSFPSALLLKDQWGLLRIPQQNLHDKNVWLQRRLVLSPLSQQPRSRDKKRH